MIVHIENSAVVAEKIIYWDVWSYPDFPCAERPEGWLQVYLMGTLGHPVVVWIGSKPLARELLLILPAWVDGHLKAGTPEINLGQEIERLLDEGKTPPKPEIAP